MIKKAINKFNDEYNFITRIWKRLSNIFETFDIFFMYKVFYNNLKILLSIIFLYEYFLNYNLNVFSIFIFFIKITFSVT